MIKVREVPNQKCFALKNPRVEQENFAKDYRQIGIYKFMLHHPLPPTLTLNGEYKRSVAEKNINIIKMITPFVFYGIPIFYIIQIVSQYINFEQ